MTSSMLGAVYALDTHTHTNTQTKDPYMDITHQAVRRGTDAPGVQNSSVSFAVLEEAHVRNCGSEPDLPINTSLLRLRLCIIA